MAGTGAQIERITDNSLFSRQWRLHWALWGSCFCLWCYSSPGSCLMTGHHPKASVRLEFRPCRVAVVALVCGFFFFLWCSWEGRGPSNQKQFLQWSGCRRNDMLRDYYFCYSRVGFIVQKHSTELLSYFWKAVWADSPNLGIGLHLTRFWDTFIKRCFNTHMRCMGPDLVNSYSRPKIGILRAWIIRHFVHN